MPTSALSTLALGPFQGLLDTKGASIPVPGALRTARNLVFSGDKKLSVMGGSSVALTLKDDAGTPATVTKVLHVGPFMDGAIAIAYSSATQKVYLYRLPATMDGWYDSTGAAKTTLTPSPVCVLWSAVTVAPDVSVAEGLGMLYVAQTSAIDVNGAYFKTQTVTFSTAGVPTQADLKANGTGGSAGTDTAYFTLVCAFHQHVWGWGYGAGSTPGYTSYRPELGKFSQPSFGEFQTADSIVFGDKVRALRERPVCAVVAGNAMFVAASKYLFRVIGYGRDSWQIETLDQKYGVVGPKAAVAVGNTLYYWTSRGPMRCADGGIPEPLWDAVALAVSTVANESQIVAGFDAVSDRVLFTYDTGSGVRTLCSYDVRRDAFTSGDGDVGLVIACAGVVEPIYGSTATPPAAPSAPTIVSTTLVSYSTATCTWANTDPAAQTELSYRVQGNPSYVTIPLQDVGVTSYALGSLTTGTAYEWRVRHYRGGVYSTYTGPVAASQFTTLGGATGPTAPSGLTATGGARTVALAWTNGDATLPIQVFRSTDGVSFAQITTVAAGLTAYTDTPGSHGTFYYRVRHIAADGTPSDFSFAASATI